jgi:hypothetical protein
MILTIEPRNVLMLGHLWLEALNHILGVGITYIVRGAAAASATHVAQLELI